MKKERLWELSLWWKDANSHTFKSHDKYMRYRWDGNYDNLDRESVRTSLNVLYEYI
jgi:hypothetical protein